MEELINRMNAMCSESPFQSGWYLKNLQTNESANYYGDVVVPSASTRKIAILMNAMKWIHEGKLSLDQPIRIDETNQYVGNSSGCFQYLRPGFTVQLYDVLTMMIIVSDNTSTGIVANLLGLDSINEFSQSIGMIGTTHRHKLPPLDLSIDHSLDYTNSTTPNDVGLILELILLGTNDEKVANKLGSSKELCQIALDILLNQKLNNKLPALLPKGTKVAHKTGTGARNYNDAGIIFLDDSPLFILTVFTENVPTSLADGRAGHGVACDLVARLSSEAYNYFIN
ncbi:MAG: serine hydrolase [SAR202 cluster bacterium]|nr:serine hydrolase [Chloroflexota bacterium]MQG51519.1 serine hydrolase [SAR202 cluster bacterium]|tara:strand:- start:1561 stop:2409 length:849 start_codon:yes stop_codon:yes gene_type:complete